MDTLAIKPSLIMDAELFKAIDKLTKKEIINPKSKKSNNFLTEEASSFTKRKIKGNKSNETDLCNTSNPYERLSV
ncbi:hypothetical protein GCM10009430_07510 [Aquimarina litoralis]|uniref:Uncharacterized protein n=1 Tax=Aquimarina litoralis TaxID=584605 RepID=A0ABP3TP68_9FLAO